MTSPRMRRIAMGMALSALVVLSACKTAEERAEEHYQNSLSLIEAGDPERAVVELRNVFELDGLHREARLTYAELMRGWGDFREAYRHYGLLAEQYPQDVVPRKWLFRIAMIGNDFTEARSQGERALELAPDDPEVQAIGAMLDYLTAVFDDAPEARRAAAARLDAIAVGVDDMLLYVPTLIDNHVREGEFREALEKIDGLLQLNPALENWQQLRLRVLTELGEDEAVAAQLQTLVDLFPGNADYALALVQWHVSRDETEVAEAFLRAQAANATAEEKFERQVQLVGFISGTVGPDAAIAELERLTSDSDQPEMLLAMRAGILFDEGQRDAAIVAMRDIVDRADGSENARNTRNLLDIEVNLAQMLLLAGEEDEARERIAAVLEEDETHPGALKQNAAWLIEADRMDEAIIELRAALGRDADDPEIMSLLAEAHIRNGSRNLAGEMLSLAVETSGAAPEQSLAYAQFLIGGGNLRSAEDVLIDSLRGEPDNAAVLALLGRIYVQTNDWVRAGDVEDGLRDIGSEEAAALADALRVDTLRAQRRGQEAIRFLTDLAESRGGDIAAEIAVARTHMENGNFADAEAFIAARLEVYPGQPEMRMMLAALYAQTSRGEEAEGILRDLVTEDPSREIVWRTLYETKLRLGAVDEASALLSEALAAVPDAPDLLWARAGELERAGDMDGAIEIYETLYERLPNSPVIANNLASLLSMHRDGPEALDRAFTIARRLRGSDVPAFQDTYGWIAHLRGEVDEALTHLEPAADAMPDDPYVQFHLGMAYAASGDRESALEALNRALALAPPGADQPQFETARAEIARLEAEMAQQEDGN